MTERPPLALYVHWPFCLAKCPYCDFNSHVRDTVDLDAWHDALLADLAHEAAQLPGRTLGSIFFGGGTPSLMAPRTVAAIIEAATRSWPPHADIEITLEANPSSVEAARFADFAAAGVNRVSLGIQSLDDDSLRFLGRVHDVGQALTALETAQRHFSRVNIDLIYALPDQSLDKWESELSCALSFGTEHLSLYQLTIEPGTRFATLVAKGHLTPADNDHAADLYDLTRTLTRAANRPAYEISNHAAPGAESRHNLTYWRYGDYAGIGPGAHGRRGNMATLRHKKPENWLNAVARNWHGLVSEQALDAPTRAAEALLMGLRLREGINPDHVATLTDMTAGRLVDHTAIARLSDLGLIEANPTRIGVTDAGMLLLDAILPQILQTHG